MSESLLEDFHDTFDSKNTTKLPLPNNKDNQVRRFCPRQTLASIVPNDHNRNWSDKDEFESSSMDLIEVFALRSPNCCSKRPNSVAQTNKDGWVEIISDQVLEEINAETAKASISFQVQQHWGIVGVQCPKWKLRIRILDDTDQQQVLSNTIIDCKSCQERDDGVVEIFFDSSHDIIRKCKIGRTFVIEMNNTIGKAEFNLLNLEFKIESGPSVGELKRREQLGKNIAELGKMIYSTFISLSELEF